MFVFSGDTYTYVRALVKIVDNRDKRKCAPDWERSALGLRRFRRIPKNASPPSCVRHVQKRIYSLRHERMGGWAGDVVIR